jgi:hypothetical protein
VEAERAFVRYVNARSAARRESAAVVGLGATARQVGMTLFPTMMRLRMA